MVEAICSVAFQFKKRAESDKIFGQFISESNFLTEYTDVPGVQRNLKLVTTGIKLNGEHPTAANPPSALGAHNEEIFNGLGVSSVELKELKRQGIV